jgi:3-hydroxyacyl-CoA dehydrogenase/enoyl-CoA hydratase/3-hydroxybutyryl-CoA epimerase
MADDALSDLPELGEFSLEIDADRLATLTFDCPGRKVNLLSPAAVRDIEAVADWLPGAPVRGVILRSGKPGNFCAGADINDLQRGLERVAVAPDRLRFQTAYDQFFPTSKILRKLERAGKPIVAVIDGAALGGGLEFALAAHHRIVVDSPRTTLSLPEVGLGLIAGAGGTQRLPRTVGLSAALPLLLDGQAIGAQVAADIGLADIVPPGAEMDHARRLLMSLPANAQPWDEPEWIDPAANDVAAALRPLHAALSDRSGPASTAVLDALQFGLPQPFDGAIRSEIAVFCHLIQRPETANVLRVTFMGRSDYAKLSRDGALAPGFGEAIDEAERFRDGRSATDQVASAFLHDLATAIAPTGRHIPDSQRRALDHIVREVVGYPPYWGGISQHF